MLKVWQLKNSTCDNSKNKIVTKKSNHEKTQTESIITQKLKMWLKLWKKNSNTQVVRKLKKSNCDKLKKNKKKLQNPKTQIVTKLSSNFDIMHKFLSGKLLASRKDY